MFEFEFVVYGGETRPNLFVYCVHCVCVCVCVCVCLRLIGALN